MHKNKIKKQQLIIFIFIILCFITLTVTFGRYVSNSINNFFLRSKEFYFYSDKLKENTAVYQISNWTGVDPYTITINMNSLENNLKKTNYDISYEVTYTCTSNATCQLSKQNGTILGSTNTDYFNLVITPNTGLNVGDEVTVTIEATSTHPYEKTLSAEFTFIVGREQLSYEIVDSTNNEYLELDLTNTLSYYNVETPFGIYSQGDRIDVDTYLTLTDEDKEKCYSAMVTLEFNPNEILLDMTNKNYENAINVTTTNINGDNYINSITFKVEPISSAVVRFYKIDISKDYTYPIINETSIVKVTSK